MPRLFKHSVAEAESLHFKGDGAIPNTYRFGRCGCAKNLHNSLHKPRKCVVFTHECGSNRSFIVSPEVTEVVSHERYQSDSLEICISPLGEGLGAKEQLKSDASHSEDLRPSFLSANVCARQPKFKKGWAVCVR